MEVEEVKHLENEKYMWDGAIYDTEEEAENKKAEYQEKDFQVQLFEQEGKYLLYTRRVVTEIVLEGEAPP
ncbi:hypothetical protein HQ563_16355 [bacterium]|nr:hypothetical protein [bacterium]